MSIRRRRKLLYILGGTLYCLVAVLAISIALLPTLTRVAFKHWLEQQHLQGDLAYFGLSLQRGTLTVLDAEINDGQTPLLKLGKLQLRIKLRDLLERKLTIEQVTLNNTRLQIQQHKHALIVAGIRLNQTGTPTPAPGKNKTASAAWTIQLNKLHIANLDTCLITSRTKQPLHVCNHLGELAWNGHVDITTNNPLAVKSTGTLALSKLTLRDEKQNLPLLRFDSLALSSIRINGLDRIRLDSVELQHLKMLPNQDKQAKAAGTLAIGKLQINSVSLNKLAELNIAAINIDDIASYIKLTADNRIASLKQVTAYQPAATERGKTKVTAKPAAGSPFRIKVGKIKVTTTRPLVLEDAHSEPPVTQRIDHFSLVLGAIDSSKPGQASELATQFKYGKYGKVKVNGTVRVFAARPTLNLKARIVGVNLNRVSSYTRELLQHKIKSGQLNARLVIRIKQGKLDSDAKLTLYKFYVSKLSGKEADKYQKSLGIPLSAALSLLRDKDDTIRIDLPVTGDIENPDFSFNDIIATVSAKAIKVAIVNYYATLGLVKLVTGAFDLMTALRFDPLPFQPGQTGLTDASRQALDKFAEMLSNRPQVHLVVCGHATVADQLKLFPPQKPATDAATTTNNSKTSPLTRQQLQQLNKLAAMRDENVKQYLVEKKGVAADRLIECNPEYQPDDQHNPYVELHI